MMKKMIFLFMALLMGNVIKAQQTICKDVVEQVKAIVAYEMNVLSLHPNEKNNKKDTKLFEDFKKCASEKLTVDDVKKCLPANYTKSKELCDDIKKFNSKFTDVNALAAYYSDSIFQQEGGAIGKFVKKRDENDVARLKKTIKERIQEVTDKAEVLFDPEEKVSGEPSEVENKEQKNTENDNNPQSQPKGDPSGNQTSVFTEILKKYSGYLLAFVVVVIAVILFKNKRSLEYECHSLRDDKKRNDELLRKKIAEAEKKIHQLKQKNAELKEQNQQLQEDVENLQAASKQQRVQSTAATGSYATTHEKKTVHDSPREYYLGVPQNGKFAEGSEVYRPGKVVYKVISNDGVYGEFEYINRPEAIGYAKQSRTSFLESACNITNEGKTDFVQIETREKGKVERTSDGWKIIKKADVCLV